MRVRTTFLLLVVALVAVSAPCVAGEDDDKTAYLRIQGGSAGQFPLALPSFKMGIGGDPATADLMYQVIQRDLQLSGYFQIIDQLAYIEANSAGLAPGEFDFADWRVPGAAGLVKSGLSIEGDMLSVELHVYDVDGGVRTLARTLSGRKDQKRQLAHSVANAVIEAFTGEPGVFDTRIVAVANFGQGKEVYVFDFDGEGRTSVSKNGSINLSPAWSPDGSRITYTSYRDNNPDLWMTDLRTGRHTKLSGRPGINAGAEWSPDGEEIALTLSKEQGNSDIYALDTSGSIVRRMTRHWAIDVSPSYSPDGSKIAFVSARLGSPQIFVMNREDSEPTRLTQRGGHNVSPAWSPDGSRLAFAGRDEGRFDIFVVNSDGSGLRRLTQSSGDDEDPTWSPDGNHILFSSSRDGLGKQLYIMTADGKAQTRITDGTGSFSNPMWGPRLD